jgi:hypothetical protein
VLPVGTDSVRSDEVDSALSGATVPGSSEEVDSVALGSLGAVSLEEVGCSSPKVVESTVPSSVPSGSVVASSLEAFNANPMQTDAITAIATATGIAIIKNFLLNKNSFFKKSFIFISESLSALYSK